MKKVIFQKKYQQLFKQNKDIFFFFLYSGRAAGKSFAISTYLANRLLNQIGNCVFCRQYMTNTATSVIPEFLQKIQLLNISQYLNIYKDHIQCKLNGNNLWFKGLQTSQGTAQASLKGIPKLGCVVIDEMQQVKQPAFDRLIGTVRDKNLNLKIICALNPTDINSWQYKRYFLDLDYNFTGRIDNKYYIYSSYLDNIKYLAESSLHQIENLKQVNLIKYENQYLGKWLLNSQNILFNQGLIDKSLQRYQSKLATKYVIAIDPAVSTNKTSDQTGICVAMKDQTNNYFILESISGKYSPNQWCNIVKRLKQKYKNSQIVAQKNQGGDLIKEALHNVGLNTVKLVTATKSKILRAEDIVVLFQTNKVHFLKRFDQLFYQMLTYNGDPKQKSPNQLDAMVWALKELSQGGNSQTLYLS